MFRESSGAAGLSGRDLPVGETLAAYASLDARARLYQESGAFPGERLDRLRAAAYLDILNGISAADRIACGHLSSDPAPDTVPPTPPTTTVPASHGGPVRRRALDGPGRAGRTARDECDGRCAPRRQRLLDEEPDDDEPDDEPNDGPGDGTCGDGSPTRRPDGGGPAAASQPAATLRRTSARSPPAIAVPGARGPPPTLTDLVLPLATLLGLAERPGEGHGLGALDPALCRALAATAALSRYTTLCVTVTNADGIAIGHGCVKPGRLARPARRTAPAPDRAPGPDQSHRHRRPTGRTTCTAADRASRTYGTSTASRTRTTSWISADRLGARPPWRRLAR